METAGIYLKRILKITGFLCVLGIAGYGFFQASNLRAESEASKEITKEIQKIKDAGEPTTIEELVPPDIPDGENGALVYNQAFSLLKELKERHKEEWKHVPYDGEVKWNEAPEAVKEKVRNLLLQNPDFAKFYLLLEKASGMKCRFLKREYYRKGAAIMLPHLASLRSCARMLAARADIQVEKGAADNALKDCLTGLKISNSLSEEPILITGLVRIAIDNVILDRVEEIMRKREARPETYRLLIKEVMRERNDKMIYQGLLGERVVFGLTAFSRLRAGVKDKESANTLTDLLELSGRSGDEVPESFEKDPETFWEENELAYLKTTAVLVSSSKKPYWEIRDNLAQVERDVAVLPNEKSALVKLLIPAVFKTFLNEARIDARLGEAEIALAGHLYKTKKKNYPVFLKELSPAYLPELPLDPFTGKGYVYRKTSKGFKIYSLGENLKDDGGKWGYKENKWNYDIVWEK